MSYVKIVKETAHLVAPKALEITKAFYPRLFKNNPEVYRYFNKSNQRNDRQPHALAEAVISFARNIDNFSSISHALDLMAHKHCALGVQEEDYAVVHKNLMEAVVEVMKIDGEIANGWSDAVLALAGILIKRERDLYDSAASRRGGWEGKRVFLVDEVVPEAKDVISILFKPKDGKCPQYTAGDMFILR